MWSCCSCILRYESVANFARFSLFHAAKFGRSFMFIFRVRSRTIFRGYYCAPYGMRWFVSYWVPSVNVCIRHILQGITHSVRFQFESLGYLKRGEPVMILVQHPADVGMI